MLQNNNNSHMLFATRLRNIRVNLHITGKYLAELSGFSRGRISEYETGKRLPTEDNFKLLCGVLTTLGVNRDDMESLARGWQVTLAHSSGQRQGRILRA